MFIWRHLTFLMKWNWLWRDYSGSERNKKYGIISYKNIRESNYPRMVSLLFSLLHITLPSKVSLKVAVKSVSHKNSDLCVLEKDKRLFVLGFLITYFPVIFVHWTNCTSQDYSYLHHRNGNSIRTTELAAVLLLSSWGFQNWQRNHVNAGMNNIFVVFLYEPLECEFRGKG